MTAASGPAPSPGARLRHVDAIRGIAMLLGIPFHVGLIYSAGHEWFVASPETSIAVTVVTGLLTSFRMPLFFFVAGLLAAALLSRKPAAEWVWRRIERLGVPLLTSTLFISPIVIMAMAYDRQATGPGSSYGATLMKMLLEPGGQWVGHLWFIQCLLVYSLGTPLMLRALRAIAPRLHQAIPAGLQNPVVALLLVAALVSFYRFGVNGAFFVLESAVPGSRSVTALVKLPAYFDFLPFYVFGLWAFNITLPKFYRSPLTWLVLLTAAMFYAEYWNLPGLKEKMFSYAALGFLSVLCTFVIFTMSADLVKKDNPTINYLVDASFTIYLVHYPIIIWLGFIFKNIHADPIIEYALCIFVTAALSFLLHEGVKRSARLSYYLNGKPFTHPQAALAGQGSPTS